MVCSIEVIGQSKRSMGNGIDNSRTVQLLSMEMAIILQTMVILLLLLLLL